MSRDHSSSRLASHAYETSTLRSFDPNNTSPLSLILASTDALNTKRVEQHPNLPYYYRVPEFNRSYFKRDEILKSLEAALNSSWENDQLPESDPDRIRTFALCGDAGSGKTQIAAHFVHVHKDRYDAIFWLSAQDVTKLWTAYDQIAAELPLKTRSGARDMIASRNLVRDWLSDSSRPMHRGLPMKERVRWLLVFDNVEETEMLQEFWPLGGSGHILLTSQHPLTTTANFFGQLGVRIEPLDKNLAVRFLTQMTKGNLRPDQTLRAGRLAETLGGLPLALVSMSHLINEGYLTLDDNGLDRIYRKRESLVKLNRVRSIETNEAYDHVEFVVFTQLESLRSSATLMDVLSLLDNDCILETHLSQAAHYVTLEGFPQSENAYYDARAELLNASLVTKSGEGLSLHRTIQELAIVRMEKRRFQRVFEAAVYMLSGLWPKASIVERHNVMRWDEYAGLLPHILRLNEIFEDVLLLDLAAEFKLLFAELLNNASW
jgi:hypothetical protein